MTTPLARLSPAARLHRQAVQRAYQVRYQARDRAERLALAELMAERGWVYSYVFTAWVPRKERRGRGMES